MYHGCQRINDFEPKRDKPNNIQDLDKPVNLPSLIRVFAVGAEVPIEATLNVNSEASDQTGYTCRC